MCGGDERVRIKIRDTLLQCLHKLWWRGERLHHTFLCICWVWSVLVQFAMLYLKGTWSKKSFERGKGQDGEIHIYKLKSSCTSAVNMQQVHGKDCIVNTNRLNLLSFAICWHVCYCERGVHMHEFICNVFCCCLATISLEINEKAVCQPGTFLLLYL